MEQLKNQEYLDQRSENPEFITTTNPREFLVIRVNSDDYNKVTIDKIVFEEGMNLEEVKASYLSKAGVSYEADVNERVVFDFENSGNNVYHFKPGS
jgi:hypothetical protein